MSEKKLAVSDPRAVAFCDAIRGMAPENRERLLCAMEGHLKAQSLQAHSNARLWLLVAIVQSLIALGYAYKLIELIETVFHHG